ncbi:MAG: class II aldolase/adducin family protein [Pseudomonadales bacterium]|nr:class II aldolase/adducin family protein [Pseudomonadales bacterium]
MKELSLRQQIIDAACAMHIDGLTVANSGNVSARSERGLLITPSGVAYESLTPESLVELNLSGEKLSGQLQASSEWHFHCAIYREKTDVAAIVHAHSPAATALSCLRKPLPAFHYMVALAGGYEIPCADYATFGTEELSHSVLSALKGYKACLMANHGMTVTGANIDGAYKLALEVESLCEMYHKAAVLGDVVLLSDKEMQEAADAFVVYGRAVKKGPNKA